MTHREGSDESEQSDNLNRRHLLQGLSAGAAASLAGCGGDNAGAETTVTTTETEEEETDNEDTTAVTEEGEETEETEDTTTETTVNEQTEPVFTSIEIPMNMSVVPTKVQYNPYNQKQSPNTSLLYDRLATVHYGLEDGLIYPVMCRRVNFSGKDRLIEYELKDTKWWKPGPRFVNSDDLEAFYYSETAARNNKAFRSVSAVKKADERTLRLKLSGVINPDTNGPRTLSKTLNHAHEHWDKWVDLVKGARKTDGSYDDNELSAIQQEILTWRLDEISGNSLFQVENITPSSYVCSVNEGHMSADRWEGVEEVKFVLEKNKSRRVAKFIQGEAPWYTGGLGESAENQVLDRAERLTTPNTKGTGFGWQFKNEPFDNVKVRQAFMYIWNREDIAKSVYGRFGIVDEIPTGTIPGEDIYYTDEQLELTPTYGVTSEPDKGAEMLNMVQGLEKPQGADWWQYNEETWEPVFTTEASGSRFTTGRVTSDQLREFGIKVDFQPVDGGKMWGVLYENRTFDQFPGAAYNDWGNPSPYQGMVDNLSDAAYIGQFGFPGACNGPGVVKAPEFLTEWDPLSVSEDDLVEYDTCAMERMEGAVTEEEALQILRRGAWVFSYQIPFAPLVGNQNAAYLKTDQWTLNVDADDSPNHLKMTGPQENLVTLGLYHPKRVEQ